MIDKTKDNTFRSLVYSNLGESLAELHILSDKWVLWAHLPHDTDWSLQSYKEIMEMADAKDIVKLYNNIPEVLVKNCMLFLMRKNIK